MRSVLLLPVLLLSLTLSCKPPPGAPPGTGVPGLLNCAAEAVKAKWPAVLPAVNRCLAAAATSEWFDCLLGLIEPTAGVTEEIIACTVQSSGRSYADAGARGDVLSAKASARATEYIKQRGYRFAP